MATLKQILLSCGKRKPQVQSLFTPVNALNCKILALEILKNLSNFLALNLYYKNVWKLHHVK